MTINELDTLLRDAPDELDRMIRNASAKLAPMIRDARLQQGLTQAQLARRLRVNQSAIAQWETGRTTPDIERRAQLARILKLLPLDLLPEADLLPNSLLGEAFQRQQLIQHYRRMSPASREAALALAKALVKPYRNA